MRRWRSSTTMTRSHFVKRKDVDGKPRLMAIAVLWDSVTCVSTCGAADAAATMVRILPRRSPSSLRRPTSALPSYTRGCPSFCRTTTPSRPGSTRRPANGRRSTRHCSSPSRTRTVSTATPSRPRSARSETTRQTSSSCVLSVDDTDRLARRREEGLAQFVLPEAGVAEEGQLLVAVEESR